MADEQIVLLQQKLDNHIEDYKKHCEEQDKRWDLVIVAQERNTEAIKDLTDSSRDLLSVWKAADGTVKTMSALGKFVKWLSGFAVLGVTINWIIDHIK